MGKKRESAGRVLKFDNEPSWLSANLNGRHRSRATQSSISCGLLADCDSFFSHQVRFFFVGKFRTNTSSSCSIYRRARCFFIRLHVFFRNQCIVSVWCIGFSSWNDWRIISRFRLSASEFVELNRLRDPVNETRGAFVGNSKEDVALATISISMGICFSMSRNFYKRRFMERRIQQECLAGGDNAP